MGIDLKGFLVFFFFLLFLAGISTIEHFSHGISEIDIT